MLTSNVNPFVGILVLLFSTSVGSAQIYPRGTISKLDLDNGVITLNVGREATPRLESYSLANKNITVTTNVKIAYEMKRVAPGMDVKLTLSPFDDVVAIMIMCPRIQYWIKGVDTRKNTITVQTRGEGQTPKTLPVHKDARIRIHSKEVPLDGLYSGLYTVLLLSPDKSQVYAITNEFWRTGGDPHGILIKTDPVKRTITLLTNKKGTYQLVQYGVPDEVKLVFRNERMPLDFADFPVAHNFAELEYTTPVWLRLADDQKNILSINANPLSLEGEVIAVDKDQDTITLRNRKNHEISFACSEETQFILNKRTVKSIDVRKGMVIEVRLSFSGKRAVEIRATD